MRVGADDTRWVVLVSGDQTGGRFSAVETLVPKGCEPPRHVHSREDEVIYVLDGSVTFELEGERHDGTAGTCMLLPCGREHSFTIESDDARLLFLLLPAGLEGWVGAASAEDLSGGSPAVERFVATAARYGVSISGPSNRS